MSQFMTVAEAASALHVGAQTVRAWIRDGRLPAIKVGNKVWHVPTEAIAVLERASWRAGALTRDTIPGAIAR